MKALRQRLIADLLRSRKISSQSALAAALAADGHRVTQATLSRDLEELGAVRVREGSGRPIYRIPEEPTDSHEHLRHMLQTFVTEVTPARHMVVVRTPPGCAQAVARALDTARVDGALATIAGDDTILVVCAEGATARGLVATLDQLRSNQTSQGATR
jgi:transcriptional regulator of arginine metabolism